MLKDRLKQLRKERGLTQEALASILGLERSSVGKYEGKSETIPSPDILDAIATYFNVSVDYLLGRSNFQAVSKEKKPSKGIWIDVLGNVAAGTPIEAIEDIIDQEEISLEMASQGEHFGLRIHGDSMLPRMCEGDVVIVRKQSDAEDGDIAVVLVNGDSATVKRLRKRHDGLMLQPFNPEYEPMFYSKAQVESLPVVVIGKVVELRAKF